MGSSFNNRRDTPLPEIEAADDKAIDANRSFDFPLHAFPLPLPKQYDECREDDTEPTLYKKVIYIPDSAKASETSRKAKMTNITEDSPCCERETQTCQGKEEQLHRSSKDTTRRNSIAESQNLLHRWFPKIQIMECLSSYKSEWKNCFEFNVIATANYMFWENLVWGLLMGSWLQTRTNGKVGAVEVFASNLLCGTTFVLLGGQALLSVGVSATSVMFIISVAEAADRLLIEFLPWMGWIAIWGSVALFILTVSGACRIATRVITSFTRDVVETFIVLSLLWNVAEDVLRAFGNNGSLESSLLFLWLATFSFAVSTFLGHVGSFRLVKRQLCRFIGNWALPITLFLSTGIAYLPRLNHPHLQTLVFPTTGLRTDGVSELGSLVKLKSVPLWAVFLAIIPGSLLASMIFVEHIVASALIQDKISVDASRWKPRSWDVFLIAFLMLLCGLSGFPFCDAIFLQSLKHVKALTNYRSRDLESQDFENNIKVQRVSGLISSLLLGLTLLPGISWMTAKIPLAAVAGLFVEVALQMFSHLQFYEHMKTLLSEPLPHSNPSTQRNIHKSIAQYVSIQIVCSVIILVTSKTPAAVLFPLFILLTMWIRQCPLHTPFLRKGLDKLDLKLIGNQPKTKQPAEAVKIFSNPHARRHIRKTHKKIASLIEEQHCSGDSDQPIQSTAELPKATKRRLRERSLRRNKRVRHTITSHQHGQQQPHTLVLPLPCKYKLNRPEYLQSEIDHSLSLVKSNSPQIIGTPGLENSIEMHSNILYDMNTDLPTPSSMFSPSKPWETTSKPSSVSTPDLRPISYPVGNRSQHMRSMIESSKTRDHDLGLAEDAITYQGPASRPLFKAKKFPSSPLNIGHHSHFETDHELLGTSSNPTRPYEEKTVINVESDKHKISTGPFQLRKQETFPFGTVGKNSLASRLHPDRGFDKAFLGSLPTESSKRTRMILSQGRWPSNKPASGSAHCHRRY